MPTKTRAPATAVAANGMRQPQPSTRKAPIIGAIIGAAVNTMTMTDKRRADCAPLDTSRTIARASTMPEAAPMPCTKRAASRIATLSLSDVTAPAAVNNPMPA